MAPLHMFDLIHIIPADNKPHKRTSFLQYMFICTAIPATEPLEEPLLHNSYNTIYH